MIPDGKQRAQIALAADHIEGLDGNARFDEVHRSSTIGAVLEASSNWLEKASRETVPDADRAASGAGRTHDDRQGPLPYNR